MHATPPSTANCPLFAFQALTTGVGEESIAVYSITRGQLNVNVANIFIKDMANGRRQLATHPSQRRHHHAHELLDDYRKWRLLQEIKTRSNHPRQRHHHLHFIVIIFVGRL